MSQPKITRHLVADQLRLQFKAVPYGVRFLQGRILIKMRVNEYSIKKLTSDQFINAENLTIPIAVSQDRS